MSYVKVGKLSLTSALVVRILNLLTNSLRRCTLSVHRSPTTVLQCLRSWAILSISPQLRPTSSMFVMRLRLQEFFGPPLFLLSEPKTELN